MARNFNDWLMAYCTHTAHLEAPVNLHFFSGVAAIAGVLRRHVWFDQGYFSWYPNFYIIIVAKPGIVNKSTSIGVAMDLLREVPGVHIGPSSVTWQAMVQHMGNVSEQVDIAGEFHTQSCLTFVASELGTLIDFHNREMIDVLVDLWDGKTGSWDKMTKMSGKESIVNPWVSFIAGTTPSWLETNVPVGAIGGGFTSRCIFIYGREKRQLVAYPKKDLPSDYFLTRQKLIEDLEHISLIKGEYTLDKEAQAYGQIWYEKLWTETPDHLRGDRFEGYLARKQTHLHKLCMVLAASRRDERVIMLDDFLMAENLLRSIEDDMILALDRVGRSGSGITLEQFLGWLTQKGEATKEECIRYLAKTLPSNEVENLFNLSIQAGYVAMLQRGSHVIIRATGMSTESLESTGASLESLLDLPPSARSPGAAA